MPSSADPLTPVTTWQEVRDRSVMPFGIVNPVPLYHYLLYGLVQALHLEVAIAGRFLIGKVHP